MIQRNGMDGNTLILDALVRELQRKTTVTGSFSRKVAAPVSNEQFFRQIERSDHTSESMERSTSPFL